jgi:hypothetical protein
MARLRAEHAHHPFRVRPRFDHNNISDEPLPYPVTMGAEWKLAVSGVGSLRIHWRPAAG